MDPLITSSLDHSTLLALLSITGFILSLLLGIVSYFLKKFVQQLELLREVVQQLQITVSTEKSRSDGFWIACEHSHKIVERRLNDHAKSINEHALKIEKHDIQISQLKKP